MFSQKIVSPSYVRSRIQKLVKTFSVKYNQWSGFSSVENEEFQTQVMNDVAVQSMQSVGMSATTVDAAKSTVHDILKSINVVPLKFLLYEN